MLKIPMQIYLDHDLILFYKDYAAKQKKTFASIVRSALEQHKAELGKKPVSKAAKLHKAKKITEKPHAGLTGRHLEFWKAVKRSQKIFRNAPYYHPELSDDELLYGKSA